MIMKRKDEKNVKKESCEKIVKKEYVAPVILVDIVLMEFGIAASSTMVVPNNNQVYDEWEVDSDDNRKTAW